jgi:hypothetical protein
VMIFVLTTLFVVFGVIGLLGGFVIGNRRATDRGRQDVASTRTWWCTHFEAMRRVAEGLAQRDLGIAQANRLVDREFKEHLATLEQWPGTPAVPAAIAAENNGRLTRLFGSDRARDG